MDVLDVQRRLLASEDESLLADEKIEVLRESLDKTLVPIPNRNFSVARSLPPFRRVLAVVPVLKPPLVEEPHCLKLNQKSKQRYL